MKRLASFLKWAAFVIIVLPFIDRQLGAQFPVMLVDTAVSNRLAEEWEPTNRYQYERGYCVQFTSETRWSQDGPLTVYTLTSVTRADEEGTTETGIYKMTCPSGPPWVFAHTHPPTSCDENGCTLGGAWSSQCYPSPTDMRTLNRSDKPFTLIQCAATAIVPVWRTQPLPLVSPPPESHR